MIIKKQVPGGEKSIIPLFSYCNIVCKLLNHKGNQSCSVRRMSGRRKYPKSKIPVLTDNRNSNENVKKSLVSQGFKEVISNACARKPVTRVGGRTKKEKIKETNNKTSKAKASEQSRKNAKSLLEKQKEQLQGFTFETDENAFQTIKHGGLPDPRMGLYKSPATPNQYKNQRKATPKKTPTLFSGRPSVYQTYKPVFLNSENLKSSVLLKPEAGPLAPEQTVPAERQYKSPATYNQQKGQRKATPRNTPSPFCGRPSVYKTFKPVFRNFEDIKSSVVLRPDVDLPTCKQTPEKAVLVFPNSLNNNSSSRNVTHQSSEKQGQKNIFPKESPQLTCSSDCLVKENPTNAKCHDQKCSKESEKENFPIQQSHVLSKPFAKTNENVVASKTSGLDTNPTKLHGNRLTSFSSNHEHCQPSQISRKKCGLPHHLITQSTLSFPVVTPKPVKKNQHFTEETTASPELRERLSVVNSLPLGAPIRTPLVLRDIARRDEEVVEPHTTTTTPHVHVTCVSNCRDGFPAQQCQPPSAHTTTTTPHVHVTCVSNCRDCFPAQQCQPPSEDGKRCISGLDHLATIHTPVSQHGSLLKQSSTGKQRICVPLENDLQRNSLHCSNKFGTPPSEVYLIEKLDQLSMQKIRNVLRPAEKYGNSSPVCQPYQLVSREPLLSLRKIVTRRNMDEAVADKECALYSCDHGLTSPCTLINHQEHRSINNPVAKVLAEGDEMVSIDTMMW
ncbi:uncharacterized protein LOC106475283 isoform X2 [Limulus polyphemus]|uniref:Uncharacterized protein LOC106475283 isoform X2 n=1 Tax=Limulus polyphemus TaxID=6850 RepID=A0ABM1RUT9_LIMPO|nr:uncharacterized protein LOC106475283 isoform X2 [Limulus polyphemus]